MEAETERRMGAPMIRYAKSPQDIAAEIVFSNFNKSPSNLERSIADAIEGDRKCAALAQSDAEPDEDKPIGFRTNDVPTCPARYLVGPCLFCFSSRADFFRHPYAEGPSIDEDAVNAAFDKWAKPRGYRIGNRLSFHAGVEFGLRHARPSR
jgi:hypothetical protein